MGSAFGGGGGAGDGGDDSFIEVQESATTSGMFLGSADALLPRASPKDSDSCSVGGGCGNENEVCPPRSRDVIVFVFGLEMDLIFKWDLLEMDLVFK